MSSVKKSLPIHEIALYDDDGALILTQVLKAEVLGKQATYHLKVLAVIEKSEKLKRGDEFISTVNSEKPEEKIMPLSDCYDREAAVELEKLAHAGSIDRVREMIKSGKNVRIKRSNGAWETGKASMPEKEEDWPFFVKLSWQEPSKNEASSKIVRLKEFMSWQIVF